MATIGELEEIRNQIIETCLSQKLIDELYKLLSKIIIKLKEKKEIDFNQFLMNNSGLFLEKNEINCYVCPNYLDSLKYAIEIDKEQSKFLRPADQGIFHIYAIVKYIIRCESDKCDWNKDGLIFHGYYIQLPHENQKDHPMYEPFPIGKKYTDIYVNYTTLDDVINKLGITT
ncbi:MAG: hypothetical protein AB1424_08925 [Thermodesulfobacteriota bacterium]